MDSCLNLSTTATLFCPQGGRCGEVRLKYCQQNELERHNKAPLNLCTDPSAPACPKLFQPMTKS